MSKIRPKIIEVVDTDMVSRVFIDVISCRVLSNGSLVIKYLEDAAENTKIYKKASWRYYSRIWENNYLGGYLASHPLKDDFMNEPIEFEPVLQVPDICYHCRNWDIIDARKMEGICRSHNIETYAEDGCQDIELKEEC